MTTTLNDKEFEIVTKLVQTGFEKASLSITQILKKTTYVERIELSIKEIEGRPVYTEKEGINVHVLRTEIKGDMTGFCYLIFTQNEVSEMHSACLPAEILSQDNHKTKKMKWAMLVEAANMVTAAVLTELANFFDVFMYGNIPSLKVMHGDRVNDYLQNEAIENAKKINFKGVFGSSDLNISLDFIWLLDSSFINNIKNSVNLDKSLRQA